MFGRSGRGQAAKVLDDVAGLTHEAFAVVAGDPKHGYSSAPSPLHQHGARFWVLADVDQLKLDAERFGTPANVDAERAVLEVIEGHVVVSFTRWMHERRMSYRGPIVFLRRGSLHSIEVSVRCQNA